MRQTTLFRIMASVLALFFSFEISLPLHSFASIDITTQATLSPPSDKDKIAANFRDTSKIGTPEGDTFKSDSELVFRNRSVSQVLKLEPTNMKNPGIDPDVWRSWFEKAIREGGEITGVTPKPFEEALSDWELEVVYYPFHSSKCCFNHNIRWGFNYAHKTSRVRIQLGPDEIAETFKLISLNERKRMIDQLKIKNQQRNDQWPFLRNYLDIIGLHHSKIREKLQGHPEEQKKLDAFKDIGEVKNYYSFLNVFSYEVEHDDHFLELAYKDLEKYIEVAGQLADEGQIEIDAHRILPTELQRLRIQIAGAVQDAQEGSAAGWDRIASRYSLLAENMSPFTIKVAAFLNLFGFLNSSKPKNGLAISEMKRWAFIGSGPALDVRAMNRIIPAFQSVGGNADNLEFFDIDFSQKMLEEGKKVVKLLQKEHDFSHESLLTNALETKIPLESGSLDIVETGNIGTVGEALNAEGIHKKIHLFLEMNRLLRKGGYLLFTVKNKPLSLEFQNALAQFGFKTVTPSEPTLDYDKDTMDLLTGGDRKKADKIRTHLRGASYLIAIKEKSLTVEQQQDLIKRQTEIAKLLEYSDTYEKQLERSRKHRYPLHVSEVDISDVSYENIRSPKQLNQTFISRESIEQLEEYKSFEERLTSLLWMKNKFPRREQNLVDRIEQLWDREYVSYLQSDYVSFVMNYPLQFQMTFQQSSNPYFLYRNNLETLRQEEYERAVNKVHFDYRNSPERSLNAALRRLSREHERKKYSLWDLYLEEKKHRKNENRQSLEDIFRAVLTNWERSFQAGTRYFIRGNEYVHSKASLRGLRRDYFSTKAGHTILFEEDINHGVLGYVKNSEGDTLDILYKDKNDEVINLYHYGVRRSLAWLDLHSWLSSKGKDVKPRLEDENPFRIDELNMGSVLIKDDFDLPSRGRLTIGRDYVGNAASRGFEIQGILQEDPNFGVMVAWYPYYPEENRLDKANLLNANYFDHQGELQSLNVTNSSGRVLKHLAFLQWLETRGKGVVLSTEGQAPFRVDLLGSGGKVSIKADKSLPWDGTIYPGRQFAGDLKTRGFLLEAVFQKDINHGIMVVWHPYYPEEDRLDTSTVLNINYFDKEGNPHSLNSALKSKRNLTNLDIALWIKNNGKGVVPRSENESPFRIDELKE